MSKTHLPISFSQLLGYLACLLFIAVIPCQSYATGSWHNKLTQPTKVKLQLKWTHQFQFAGYYMAQAKGFYKQQGIEVNLIPATPGIDPIKQVLNGNAQFGVGTS